jgi:hypothetical protein
MKRDIDETKAATDRHAKPPPGFPERRLGFSLLVFGYASSA